MEVQENFQNLIRKQEIMITAWNKKLFLKVLCLINMERGDTDVQDGAQEWMLLPILLTLLNL